MLHYFCKHITDTLTFLLTLQHHIGNTKMLSLRVKLRTLIYEFVAYCNFIF